MCCNVCISKCQESRSHSTLTWVFFHLPKLLQPQLKNPEKLHTGDTRPVFHTSINSLLNHRIALNWFLFLNVTSGMNWKMYFCFSYEWTVMRYLKMSSLWLCVCVCTHAARLGSFITGACRQVVYICEASQGDLSAWQLCSLTVVD